MCFARLPYQNADGIDEDHEDLDQLRSEISAWAGFDDERRVRSDLPEKLYKSLKRLLALDPNDRPGTEEILLVLKSPAVYDEFNEFAGPSGFDDLGPRISRADTPSPAPVQAHHRKRSSAHYTKPGRSKLSASVMDRSPSPVAQTQPTTTRTPSPQETSSVVLRPRKLDLPPPLDPHTHPSPVQSHSPRLMLPPPPQEPPSRLSQVVHNPTFVSVAKISVFCAKVFSLFTPCQPFSADPRVAYPLLCFASLDFLFAGFTFRGRNFGAIGSSILLLVLHVAVVTMLLRWNRLCLRRVAWEEI